MTTLFAFLLTPLTSRFRVWRKRRALRQNRAVIDAAKREADRRDRPVENEDEC